MVYERVLGEFGAGGYEYSSVLGGFGIGVDECPRCWEDLVLWVMSVPQCWEDFVLWHFESFAVLRGFNVWASSVPVLGGFCVVSLACFTDFEGFDVVCCECLSVLSVAACFECFAVLQYCGLKCSAVTGGFVFWAKSVP